LTVPGVQQPVTVTLTSPHTQRQVLKHHFVIIVSSTTTNRMLSGSVLAKES